MKVLMLQANRWLKKMSWISENFHIFLFDCVCNRIRECPMDWSTEHTPSLYLKCSLNFHHHIINTMIITDLSLTRYWSAQLREIIYIYVLKLNFIIWWYFINSVCIQIIFVWFSVWFPFDFEFCFLV